MDVQDYTKLVNALNEVVIKQSAKEGNYKGRARIRIDKHAAQEIFWDYQNKKINSIEAAQLPEISKSTFLRRYREYKGTRQ